MPKRSDYISWDEFFMGVAELASKRSKDPRTRHGACIVDPMTNRILSVGYNGLPQSLDDDGFILHGEFLDYWDRENKQDYGVHAEENAFFNAHTDLNGAVIYLYSDKGYPPCSRCARGIDQSGIKEVVLKTMIKDNTDVYDWTPTLHIFDQACIKLRVLGEEND